MHWLRSIPLEKELAAGTLSEKSKYFYFLIPCLLFPPAGYLFDLITPGSTNSNWTTYVVDLCGYAVGIVLTVIGYRWCSAIYAARNERGFIEAVIILSLPILIRLILLFFPISIGLALLTPFWPVTISGNIASILFELSWFALLIRSFQRLGARAGGSFADDEPAR